MSTTHKCDSCLLGMLLSYHDLCLKCWVHPNKWPEMHILQNNS